MAQAQSTDVVATLNRAMATHQAGNLAEAEALYRRILSVDETSSMPCT